MVAPWIPPPPDEEQDQDNAPTLADLLAQQGEAPDQASAVDDPRGYGPAYQGAPDAPYGPPAPADEGPPDWMGPLLGSHDTAPGDYAADKPWDQVTPERPGVDAPAPDLPPMPWATNAGVIPWQPNKPTLPDWDTIQRLSQGDVQPLDFLSYATRAFGKQGESTPALVEGNVPGLNLGHNPEDLIEGLPKTTIWEDVVGGARRLFSPREAGTVAETVAPATERSLAIVGKGAPAIDQAAAFDAIEGEGAFARLRDEVRAVVDTAHDEADTTDAYELLVRYGFNPQTADDIVFDVGQSAGREEMATGLQNAIVEAATGKRLYAPDTGPITINRAEDAVPATRYFRGTGADYPSEDPARFDPNGLYGPAAYYTDAPEVAGGYATTRATDMQELARLQTERNQFRAMLFDPDATAYQKQLAETNLAQMDGLIEKANAKVTSGPNVRPVDIPHDLNLLDAEAPAADGDLAHIQDALAQLDARNGTDAAARFAGALGEGPTNHGVYEALSNAFDMTGVDGKTAANKALSSMGYDGVRYAGGQRVPMTDAAGAPIEHTALAIFPESLSKVRNALSGLPGGQAEAGFATDLGGAAAGGATGYAGTEPQRPDESDADYALRRGLNVVGGAATGLGAALMASAEGRAALRDLGQRARANGLVPGLSLEDAGSLVDANGRPIGRPARGEAGGLVDAAGNPLRPGATAADWEALGPAPTPDDLAQQRLQAVRDRQAAGAAAPAPAPVPGAGARPTLPDPTAAAVEAEGPSGLRRFWDRASNVIARQGEAGQELAWRLGNWRDTAEVQAGQWVSAMPTVRSLKPAELENLRVLVADPAVAPLSERVAQAAREWDTVRAAVDASAQSVGAEGIDLAGHGNPLREVESAANRLARAQLFGPENEIAAGLLQRIGAEGGDAATARHLFDIATGAATHGDTAEAISDFLRRLQTVGKLGLSFVTNAGQSVNTASVAGLINTAKALPRALSAEGRAEALAMGVTIDGAIRDLREGGGIAGRVLGTVTAPLFNTIEKFNRTLAVHAGLNYAEEAARDAAAGSRSGVRKLDRLGLDGAGIAARGGALTDDERIAAARSVVERTQFKVDPQDLPGWASSPWGKVVAQFRQFSYNQTAFVGRELIGPALRGDVAPLATFVLLGAPVGYGLKTAQDALRAKLAPSDETPAGAAVAGLQKVGGGGIATDVVSSLAPVPGQIAHGQYARAGARLASTVLGPTAGTVAGLVEPLSKADHGNWTDLERWGLQQVPVVGPALQNTLLPYSRLADHLAPPTRDVLTRYNVPLTNPDYVPDPNEHEMTPAQLQLLHRTAGPLIDAQVRNVVQHPQFAAWSDQQRTAALAAAVARAKARHGQNAMPQWQRPDLVAALDTTPPEQLRRLGAQYQTARNKDAFLMMNIRDLGDYHAWAKAHGLQNALGNPAVLKRYTDLRP